MNHYYTEAEKQAFARRLTDTLNRKDWSQSDLARAVWGQTKTDKNGYTVVCKKDRISAYCAGKQIPEKRTLAKLATALGVDPHDLLPTVGPYRGIGPTTSAPIGEFALLPDLANPTQLRLQADVMLPAAIAAQIAALISSGIHERSRIA